jgi:hypothetical protein
MAFEKIMRGQAKLQYILDTKLVVTTIGILLITINKLLSFLAFPIPSLYPDSASYLPPGFLNFSQVSILGNSPRPWPITTTYSLLSNPTGVYLFQLLVSTLCWAFLLVTCLKYYRKSRYFVAAQSCLVVLALSPQINQWDSVILATSLTISVFLLSITFLLRTKESQKGELKNRIVFLLLILVLGSLKISNFLLVLFLLIYLLNSRKRIDSRKSQSIQSIIAILVALFVLMVGYNNNNNWSGSYSGTTLMWQLGQQSPVSARFAEHLEDQTEAPKCLFEDAPFEDPGVSFNEKSQSCAGFVGYLRQSMSSDFLKFLILNPGAVSSLVSTGAGAILSGAGSQYGNSASLLPRPVSEIYFGSTHPPFHALGIVNQSSASSIIESTSSIWIFAPSILIVALLILFSVLSQLHRGEKRNLLFLIGIVVLLIEITVSIVFLPSEWFRQTIPFVLGIFILSLILLMDSGNVKNAQE